MEKCEGREAAYFERLHFTAQLSFRDLSVCEDDQMRQTVGARLMTLVVRACGRDEAQN